MGTVWVFLGRYALKTAIYALGHQDTVHQLFANAKAHNAEAILTVIKQIAKDIEEKK